jgi:hypothetical protein
MCSPSPERPKLNALLCTLYLIYPSRLNERTVQRHSSMSFLSFMTQVFVNLKQSFLAHVTGTNRTRTATFSTPVPVSTCHDAQLSVASFSFVNPSTFNMKTMLRKTMLFALAFMLANLLFVTQAGAQQLSNVGPVTVTSDKDDYAATVYCSVYWCRI